jgi:acyl carrier protein
MTDRKTGDQVCEIVAKSFNVDPAYVSRETRAEDIDGWDSLAHATLLLRLQRIFNVKFDPAQANAAQNLGALISLVENAVSRHNG